MDKTFENKLQSKLSNFEANAPKTTWDKVNHDLEHPFETKLKGKLNGVSATVASGTWSGIESNLPGSIESGLREKLGAHEAPVSATLWGAISSQVETMPGVFEEAIQDKLANYQATPSAGVMNAIFARLNDKKIFYWRRIISSAAAVLLLFGILFFNHKSINRSAGLVANDKNPTIGEGLMPNELTNSNDNKSNENWASITSGSQSLGDKGGFKENYNSNSEKGDFLNTNTLANNNGGNITNNNKAIGNNEYSKDGLNGVHSSFEEFDQANSGKKLSAISEVDAELLASIATELPTINSIDLKEGAFSASHAAVNLTLNALPKPIIETPDDVKPLDFSLVSSNGAFAMRTKSHSMLAAYNESYTDFNEDLYQTGGYNSIGVNLALGVSKKANLLSGLQLTHARNKLEFNIHSSNSPTSLNSLVDNGNVVTNYYSPVSNQLASKRESELEYHNVDLAVLDGDSVISGNNFGLTNSFFFVDIPVGFELDLVQKHKSSITARIGAKIRMIAGANTYHVNSDRDQIIEVSSAVSQAFYQTSMVGFSGLQYQRNLNNNYEFFVGPEVNLNLTDINRTGTWVSMRPFQFGLNLGIRQKLS
ncbi:MAG: hypothetical protein JXQ87_02795 [Bacteroidia bacterium]